MSIHANTSRVATTDHDRRKAEIRESKIRDMANRGDAMIRQALPLTLHRLKGDDIRKRYPEPSQLYSDTIRAQATPFHKGFDFMARMILDGMSHQDARCFAARIVGWIESEYAADMPPLAELAPRLIIESGEASAAQITAIANPCPANSARALDETTEAIALAAIVERRLLQDSQRPQFHRIGMSR